MNAMLEASGALPGSANPPLGFLAPWPTPLPEAPIFVPYLPASVGVEIEYRLALKDAQSAAREYGNLVVLHLRQADSSVARDPYHSIKDRAGGTDLHFRSPQIDYTPTKRQLDKAGLKEDCEVVVWVAAQDLDDLGVDFNGLEQTRTTFTIAAIPGETGGVIYQLHEKGRASPFASGFLHRTFGLTRRG